MPFGLAISTERAKTLEVFIFSPHQSKSDIPTRLQGAIQDELIRRGYSSEPGVFDVTFECIETTQHDLTDPVMAEYITIMIINNKTRGKFSTKLPSAFFLTSHFQTRYPQSWKIVRSTLHIPFSVSHSFVFSYRNRRRYAYPVLYCCFLPHTMFQRGAS
jgi:hypothetical protein